MALREGNVPLLMWKNETWCPNITAVTEINGET
jgi:hypothetical protein